MRTVIGVICSIIIGYGLGCLSPAALIAKLKRENLRDHGTKNLGASNVALTFGKKLGVFVAIFDIAKAFAAYKLSAVLFPALPIAGVIAGIFAVIGHIFPFYLKFKGGKGLAAFGGLVFAVDPWMFLFLIVFGVILMIIFNQSVAISYFAAVVAPIWTGIRTESIPMALLVLCASGLILWKHYDNLKKAKRQSDVRIRDYIRTHILKK